MCSFTLSMFCHLGSFFAILKSLNGLYTLELATLPMPWLCGGIKELFVYMQFCGLYFSGFGLDQEPFFIIFLNFKF